MESSSLARSPSEEMIRNYALVTPIHRRLDYGKFEVRLLEFLPPKECDTECTIRLAISVVSLSDDIRYHALSYVWGEETNPETVIINNQPFLVTANLAAALRQLRPVFLGEANSHHGSFTPVCAWPSSASAKLLWVDAICINQSDLMEKNFCVRSMGYIYSNAKEVIAWLGPDTTTYSRTAIDLLNTIAEEPLIDFDFESLDWLERYPELHLENCSPHTEADKWPFPPPNKFWLEIHDIASNSYWRRIWTLQESALARSLWFMRGSSLIDAATLDIAIHRLTKCRGSNPEARRPQHCSQSIYDFVVSWDWTPLFGNTGRLNLNSVVDELIFSTSKSMARSSKDPRDKVYALRPFVDNCVEVDYGMPVSRVFANFAAYFVCEKKCLYLLCCSGLGTRANTFDVLPSWVPDFHATGAGALKRIGHAATLGNFIKKPHAWNNDMLENAPFRNNCDHLHVQGVTFDLVDPLCRSTISKDPFMDIVNWLRLLRTREVFEAEPYPTGIPVLHALLRLFLLARESSGRLRSSSGCRVEFSSDHAHYLVLPLLIYHGQLSITPEFSVDTCSLLKTEHRADILRLLGTVLLGASLQACDELLTNLDPEEFRSWYGRLSRAISLVFGGTDRLILTNKGYYAIVSMIVEPGDEIVLLDGCDVPFLMRPRGQQYQHVGKAYVLGLMDGEIPEILESRRKAMREYIII